MKIYKAAIIGLGPSGLAVNKILYGDSYNEIIAFESEDINKRDNIFGFWLTDWMRPFEKIIEKKWYKWTIGNKNTDVTHTSLDKPYCVISFKTWKKFCLETKNNLEIIPATNVEEVLRVALSEKLQSIDWDFSEYENSDNLKGKKSAEVELPN